MNQGEDRTLAGGSENAPQEGAERPYDPLRVTLAVYDGPFDLLLDLIKKNEMNIYDIPIAEITSQYLNYLKRMKQYDLEIAGEFFVMAATLIYIKSKMLLPAPEEEEEEEGEDPRAELVRKLLEYQAFREAAKELGLLEDERRRVYTRQVADYYLSNLSEDDAHVDAFSANLFDLLNAFQSVLKEVSSDQFHEVFEEVVTIEEKIAYLKQLITERGAVWFRELFKQNVTRNELIATFLALLEVVRSKAARVEQKVLHGDILISKCA